MSTRRRVTTVVSVVACVTAALSGATASAAATAAPKVPGTVSPYYWFRPGNTLVAGQRIEATTLAQGPRHSEVTLPGLDLVLQSDGNLVEYLARPDGGTTAVWSTHTTTATRLVFQSDHNVVLRDAAGRALWASGTAGSGASFFLPYGNGQLVTQDASGRIWSATGPVLTALPGVVIGTATAPLGEFDLVVQTDGNLVEYRRTGPSSQQPVWSSHTAGAGAVQLTAQSDGNLVLRQTATGRAVWASGRVGVAAYYQLDVQDDGNVVLYRTDGASRVQAVWATGVAVR